MNLWYRFADEPRKPTHLPSLEISKLVTEIVVSRVRRVGFLLSRSRTQRLDNGRSMFRIATLNFFSMRSFSSLSSVSAVMK